MREYASVSGSGESSDTYDITIAEMVLIRTNLCYVLDLRFTYSRILTMKRMLSLALLFGLVASFVGCGEEAKKEAP